jgi:hypothetical protein
VPLLIFKLAAFTGKAVCWFFTMILPGAFETGTESQVSMQQKAILLREEP